jgi:hypothetical protein
VERWHRPFLGLQEIPRSLTDFEISRFFTYSETELAALKSRRTPLLQVAAAIQLGFLRLSGGTLQRLGIVPKKVLDLIGSQLGVSAPSVASLRTLYQKRERTQWEHQSWAIETAGFQDLNDRQRRVLVTRLNQQALEAASVDELVTYAREWLYDHRILAPGERILRDMARSALAESDQGLYDLICKEIPQLVRTRWFAELAKQRERDGLSVVEWLMKPPSKHSPKALSSRFDRIHYLKSLGVHLHLLPAIPTEKLIALAHGVRTRRPSRFADVREPRRTLEMVAFLLVMLKQATDAALFLIDRRARDFYREAQSAAQRNAGQRLASQGELLAKIKRDAFDTALSDKAFRANVRELLDPEALVHPSNKSAAIREHLAGQSRRIRPILANLASLNIEGRGDEGSVRTLARLARMYSARVTRLPERHDCEYGKVWQSIVDGEDRFQSACGSWYSIWYLDR